MTCKEGPQEHVLAELIADDRSYRKWSIYQDEWGPGTGAHVLRRTRVSTRGLGSSDRAAFARVPGPLGGVQANRLQPTSSCAVSFKQKSKNRFRRRLSHTH